MHRWTSGARQLLRGKGALRAPDADKGHGLMSVAAKALHLEKAVAGVQSVPEGSLSDEGLVR